MGSKLRIPPPFNDINIDVRWEDVRARLSLGGEYVMCNISTSGPFFQLTKSQTNEPVALIFPLTWNPICRGGSKPTVMLQNINDPDTVILLIFKPATNLDQFSSAFMEIQTQLHLHFLAVDPFKFQASQTLQFVSNSVTTSTTVYAELKIENNAPFFTVRKQSDQSLLVSLKIQSEVESSCCFMVPPKLGDQSFISYSFYISTQTLGKDGPIYFACSSLPMMVQFVLSCNVMITRCTTLNAPPITLPPPTTPAPEPTPSQSAAPVPSPEPPSKSKSHSKEKKHHHGKDEDGKKKKDKSVKSRAEKSEPPAPAEEPPIQKPPPPQTPAVAIEVTEGPEKEPKPVQKVETPKSVPQKQKETVQSTPTPEPSPKIGEEVVKEPPAIGVEEVKEPPKPAKIGVEVVEEPLKPAKIGVEVVEEPPKPVKIGVEVVEEPLQQQKIGVEVVEDDQKVAKKKSSEPKEQNVNRSRQRRGRNVGRQRSQTKIAHDFLSTIDAENQQVQKKKECPHIQEGKLGALRSKMTDGKPETLSLPSFEDYFKRTEKKSVLVDSSLIDTKIIESLDLFDLTAPFPITSPLLCQEELLSKTISELSGPPECDLSELFDFSNNADYADDLKYASTPNVPIIASLGGIIERITSTGTSRYIEGSDGCELAFIVASLLVNGLKNGDLSEPHHLVSKIFERFAPNVSGLEQLRERIHNGSLSQEISTLSIVLLNTGILLPFLYELIMDNDFIKEEYLPSALISSVSDTDVLVQMLETLMTMKTCRIEMLPDLLDRFSNMIIYRYATVPAFPEREIYTHSPGSLDEKGLSDIVMTLLTTGLQNASGARNQERAAWKFITKVAESVPKTPVSETFVNCINEIGQRDLKNLMKSPAEMLIGFITDGVRKMIIASWILLLASKKDVVSQFYYPEAILCDPYRTKRTVECLKWLLN